MRRNATIHLIPEQLKPFNLIKKEYIDLERIDFRVYVNIFLLSNIVRISHVFNLITRFEIKLSDKLSMK
jgi:hypothetical protein